MFLTGKKVKKALVRAGREDLLDDLAEEMCQIQYGTMDGCGHLPVLTRAAGIVAQQLDVDLGDAYESVRGALQSAAHEYARDSDPVRFGRLVHDLDSRLSDYYDDEDPSARKLRRHMERQRYREEAGRKMGLDPDWNPEEGDEDADMPPPWPLDEDEQDEDVPEPGPGEMPLLDQAPPAARPQVDGLRGRKLQSGEGRPSRRQHELSGLDRAELEEQRRQVAREEDERQRTRERNVESLNEYARQRAPWLYGRPQARRRQRR
jgi:hypothetical protein